MAIAQHSPILPLLLLLLALSHSRASSPAPTPTTAVLHHRTGESMRTTAEQAVALLQAHAALNTVVVRLPAGKAFAEGARLSHKHSAPAGKRIVWQGDAAGTVISSAAGIRGWKRVGSAVNGSLWEAEAPAAVRDAGDPTGFRVVRQLWWNGTVRLDRTRSPAAAVGLTALTHAQIVPTGYSSISNASLAWPDPAGVEICSDHTWMQHRCAVEAVVPAPRPSALSACAANWTAKVPGASPGASIAELNVSSYEACQQACCEQGASICLAIIYHPTGPETNCYLLPRRYEPNYKPEGDSFVANMDDGPAPVPQASITIRQPCLSMARTKPGGSYALTYPDFLDNTGNFSGPGQWFFDRRRGKFIVYLAAGEDASAATAIVGINTTLLHLDRVQGHVFSDITFTYATWNQPQAPEGFIERYGNIIYPPPNGSQQLVPSAAAVVAAGVRDVAFEGCTFAHIGHWGLWLRNGSQAVSVVKCTFNDLGGGAMYVGDINDTLEADPGKQMADLYIADNTITSMSKDFPGAPGMHSFCTRNMTVAHNRVSDIGYTGISFCWPDPQGPEQGYNAMNAIVNNDVSRFMNYFETGDGGGIHIIGAVHNASHVSGNWFHDLAAGTPGAHGQTAQSVLYCDNHCAHLNFTNNVIENCPHTREGYVFFQRGTLGAAYDNYVNNLYLQNAGTQGGGLPCNCSNVVDVPPGEPLPPAAQAIVANAGPRT